MVDDRCLIGPKDIADWVAIDQSLQKSQFWKSRCIDKEPVLMQFVQSVHFDVINQLGRKLSGLFHHQPWFAVALHEALLDATLMGLYFGERRYHHRPDNMIEQIDYPDPASKPALPADEFPKEDDGVEHDFKPQDFQ